MNLSHKTKQLLLDSLLQSLRLWLLYGSVFFVNVLSSNGFLIVLAACFIVHSSLNVSLFIVHWMFHRSLFVACFIPTKQTNHKANTFKTTC